jgi:hypothetical protein
MNTAAFRMRKRKSLAPGGEDKACMRSVSRRNLESVSAQKLMTVRGSPGKGNHGKAY